MYSKNLHTMKINKKAVKTFWDQQAKKSNYLRPEGISNLEEDEELLEKKIGLETKKIFSWIGNLSNKTVLDLGAGTGQWSLKFAKSAKSVIAVEFSKGMQDLAISEAKKQKINNIKYELCAAESFFIDEEIDIIWISGLLCYLHDEDCENLLINCKKMISKNGRLILREPIGLQERFEIREVYSEALKTKYSNTYRTSEEYFELFARHDFKKMRDEDMFDKGSDLNKWSETRLRIFEFQV